MPENAQLTYNGSTYSFPVIVGTENETAFDISKLRDESGVITLDVGFKNTGSTASTITFIDGDEGILRYRGYPIDQLAKDANFMETAALLLHGELPTPSELDTFTKAVVAEMPLPEEARRLVMAYPKGSHPMNILLGVTSALSTLDAEGQLAKPTVAQQHAIAVRLLGKMASLAAFIHRHAQGQDYIEPRQDLGYVENFLHMMGMTEGASNQAVADALDTLLILHADHEQNCSTSTVRFVGSSQANLYASIAAGIAALWGPLHGGANQAVIEMLDEIMADGGDTDKYVLKAKDKEDSFRLMGFGHRVYKNFDPRATIIKEAADTVLTALGVKDPALGVAKRLEEVALTDTYFIDRKLYPNVDFYSGIIYRAMGIPTDMFTVMFALGRLPGWLCQWMEMRANNEPIGRPRQVYTGAPLRDYAPAGARTEKA